MTSNKQINGILMVSHIIITIAAIIAAVANLVSQGIWTWNFILLFLLASLNFIQFLLVASYDKIRNYREACVAAETYIREIEVENQEYKVNTEMLLNDPAIAQIMNRRYTAIKKEKVTQNG